MFGGVLLSTMMAVTPVVAQSVSLEVQRHVDAAKAAAGTLHEGLFKPALAGLPA